MQRSAVTGNLPKTLCNRGRITWTLRLQIETEFAVQQFGEIGAESTSRFLRGLSLAGCNRTQLAPRHADFTFHNIKGETTLVFEVLESFSEKLVCRKPSIEIGVVLKIIVHFLVDAFP